MTDQEREQQIEALARAITANFAKRNVPLDLATALLEPDGPVAIMLAEAKRQGAEEERARLAADPRELLALVSKPGPDDGLQGPTTDELVESWKRQGAVEALEGIADALRAQHLGMDSRDYIRAEARRIEQGGPIR